ncbi:MAG: hypothetical protein PHW76_07350, partial [Alphaproteobacteria bacterium]|nr:hypothetical protein [Alphaproteobacteria bacterium]
MNNESQEGFTPQYQMECAVAKADKDSGKAVLFIPEMEELFYINPDDVFRDSDNLFTLRSGRIPD